MIITEDNFFWEDRNSGLYLCIDCEFTYRDLRVMAIDDVCIKTYVWWLINGILSDKEVRCVYISFRLTDRLIIRERNWVTKTFIEHHL